MDVIKTEEYKGHEIKIFYDENAESPREWDNLGVMFYNHRNYILGDKKAPEYEIDEEGNYNYFNSWVEVGEYLKREEDAIAILPLYLYDHSGLAMKTTGFSQDPSGWDSGQVGFILATRKAVEKEYGTKEITTEIQERALGVLRSEVEAFDQYLRGEVYGYEIPDYNDSCSGFFGDMEYCLEEARGIIDFRVKKEEEEHQAKLKAQIKHHVPLESRMASISIK